MALKLSTILKALMWCIFGGIFIVGIGLGAAIPRLNFIAAPLVCPAGKMSSGSQVSNIAPGSSTQVVSLYCLDNITGAQTEINMFPLVLYSGGIYGLIAFLVVFIILALRVIRRGSQPAPSNPMTGETAKSLVGKQRVAQPEAPKMRPVGYKLKTSVTVPAADDPKDKLEKLKEMLNAGLITQEDYENKKNEILAQM